MYYSPNAISGDAVMDEIDKTSVLSEHPCLMPNH
jgi:hypothetical protein